MKDPAKRISQTDSSLSAADELIESWDELAELEHLADEGVAEAPPREGPDLDLLALLERADEQPEPAPPIARGARAEPAQDVETYAVFPELDLLVRLATYGVSEDESDAAAVERL